MATYLSPGVYVEEIPSAQQPIAGVGTNTVGFIGIVEPTITCPIPISDEEYHRRLREAEAAAAAEKRSDLEAQVATVKKAILDAQDARDKLRDQIAKVRAGQLDDPAATPQARDEFNAKKQKDEADLSRKVDQQTAQIGRQQAQLDKLNGRLDVFDDKHALAVLAVRRYDLQTFEVRAEVADSKLCTNFTEYVNRFGPARPVDAAGNPVDLDPASVAQVIPFSADQQDAPGVPINPGHRALTHAVNGFFRNGGTRCFVARLTGYDQDQIDRALRDFESIDAIAIVAAPGVVPADPNELPLGVWNSLVAHCELCRDRFAVLDSPATVEDELGNLDDKAFTFDGERRVLPNRSRNAAYYFPWLEVIDPAKQLQDQDATRAVGRKQRGAIYVPPSGHIAGIYARTDEQRGVHKAPANAPVFGATDVRYYVSRQRQDLLNPQGVNCIRSLNGNIVVWGARTIGGDLNGEWKYINVRRLFLFLAESIDEGTQWVVFEPNDQALWGKIRRNVTAFLTNVWRTGALFGATPDEAFYVKCDAETNPPEARDLGQVVTEIGVSIVRPAEFVIFRMTQSIGPKVS